MKQPQADSKFSTITSSGIVADYSRCEATRKIDQMISERSTEDDDETYNKGRRSADAQSEDYDRSSASETSKTSEDPFDEGQMEDILHRLRNDAELHKLLTDEKMRSQLHKNNYERLKSEYSRVLHDKKALTEERDYILHDKEAAEKTSRNIILKLEGEIKKLKEQIQSLDSQIPSEAQKIDLTNEVRIKTEALWRPRVVLLMEDLEAAKVSIQGLLQENLRFKTALQHVTKEADEKVNENKFQAETQVKHLIRQIHELEASQEPRLAELKKDIVLLQNENSKLRNKLKYNEDQLEDDYRVIRQLEEKLNYATSSSRVRENDQSAIIKKLETEKGELEARMKSFDSVHNDEIIKSRHLISEIHSLKSELTKSQDKLSDLASDHSDQLNKIRVHHASEKSQLICEIDLLSQRIQDMETRSSKFRKEVDSLQVELKSTGAIHHKQMSAVQNENAQLLKQMESAQSDLIERLKATQSQLNAERFRAREIESSFNAQHQQLQEELKYLRHREDDCERLHRNRNQNQNYDNFEEPKRNQIKRDVKSLSSITRDEMMIPERDLNPSTKLSKKDSTEKDYEVRVARQKSLDTKLSSNHPSEKSDRRKGLDFSPNIKRKRDRHVKSKEPAASSSPRMSSDADSANTSVASGHPHGGKEKDRSRQRKSTTRQKSSDKSDDTPIEPIVDDNVEALRFKYEDLHARHLKFAKVITKDVPLLESQASDKK